MGELGPPLLEVPHYLKFPEGPFPKELIYKEGGEEVNFFVRTNLFFNDENLGLRLWFTKGTWCGNSTDWRQIPIYQLEFLGITNIGETWESGLNKKVN